MDIELDRRPGTDRAQRIAVTVAVVGSAMVMWRPADDAFTSPKLAVVLLAALAAGCVALWRALESGVVALPRVPAAVALAAFLVLGALAVLTSDSTWRGLYGQYGRSTGFAAYLAASVLFLAALRAFRDDRAVRGFAEALLVGGVVVAGYALLQATGRDPYDWALTYGPNAPFSTLGNVNFVSGFLGSVVPIGFALAVLQAPTWRRAAAAAAAVLALLVIRRTGSDQGIVAAAVGLGVVGLAVALDRVPQLRRRLLVSVAAVAVLFTLVLGVGMTGHGPARGLADAGFEFRRDYWGAAVAMAIDDPIFGVGFDQWAEHYRAERPVHAARNTLEFATDEPHSVPLAMFAGGGFPLGIAYLAFIALVGVALVRGLLRTDGQRLVLLGGIGGAWAAYQVQSAVSIDIPSFPVLHLVLGALVLVLSGPVEWRALPLPYVSEEVQVRRRKTMTVARHSRAAGWPAALFVTVVAIVGVSQLTRPFRAGISAKQGAARAAAGDTAGLREINRATKLVPWESEYWAMIGRHFASQQNASLAYPFLRRAADNDPKRLEYVLNAARAADVADDDDAMLELYDRTIEIEPKHMSLRVEYSQALVRIGEVDKAEDLMRDALRVQPTSGEAWFELAVVLRAKADFREARDAYLRSAELLPALGGATEAAEAEQEAQAAERS